VLRGHEKGVQSAVFDPSGTRVLTTSQDNTSRIWRVFPTVAALDEHAHAIMPRELTSTQRKQFFLDSTSRPQRWRVAPSGWRVVPTG